MWGEERARAIFEFAGSGDIVTRQLEHDPLIVYFIASHEAIAGR